MLAPLLYQHPNLNATSVTKVHPHVVLTSDFHASVHFWVNLPPRKRWTTNLVVKHDNALATLIEIAQLQCRLSFASFYGRSLTTTVICSQSQSEVLRTYATYAEASLSDELQLQCVCPQE